MTTPRREHSTHTVPFSLRERERKRDYLACSLSLPLVHNKRDDHKSAPCNDYKEKE